MDFKPLGEALKSGESRIIERLLAYARKTGYVKYTSTLLEAWRFSVEGLTEALCLGAASYKDIPELGPDDDYRDDPLTSFGIVEARKHRARGITLTMFLGLMKYYRLSYRDFIERAFADPQTRVAYCLFAERCFDRMELGLVSEWSERHQTEIEQEIRTKNVEITNEKNRYLTIFESLSQPVFFVGESGEILNLNLVAAQLFTEESRSGYRYYHPADALDNLPWLPPLILEAERQDKVFRTEKRLATRQGERSFQVSLEKTLDVTQKFSGWIVILNDITEKKMAEERIFRLSRVYNVLSQTSQAIVRHKDPEALFEEICRIAVEDGHLEMALINRFHPATRQVDQAAFHGGHSDFLASMELSPWAAHAKPNVTARVLDTGRPYICNDIRRDSLLSSRAGEAEGFGFQALASFPLRCQKQLFGTFNLYAREQDFFQPDIVTLLTGMAADISFALDNFERERQRQRAETDLIQTSNKLTALFEAAPLPIMAFDAEGRVLMWNPAAEKVFGWRGKEAVNRVLPIVPEDRLPEFFEKNRRAFAGEIFAGLQVQRQRKDGHLLDLLLFNAPLYDARQNIYAVMAVLMDVTEQKKSQEQIAFLAHHDQLTGLANRILLTERFEQATAHARRSGSSLALCVLDLDGFKNVNDLLGHHQGDQLLCQVASRLQDSVRCTDTVCRTGGDEFLILFGDIAEKTALTTLICKVSEVFSRPFILQGHQQPITMSMGVAVFPEDGVDLETLFRNADAAMYFAKDAGRNNVQFFRQEISSQIRRRLSIENGLRRALAGNELLIHYQPVCKVTDNRIVGAEALIRWQHPERGWVPPGHFIPIAEETNLIIPLGDWVLEEICRTIRHWDSQGVPPLPIAVNVSAKQIFHEGFPASVSRTLQRYGIKPQRLEMEVTENLFLENLTSVETVMQELKAIGVGLALDDFGTGYSSLSYLKRFHIDKLKIDRSFIADVCHDEQDAILTDTIILLAQSLGLKAVAEGVESEGQLAFLRKCRCDYFQGYLCSRPLAGEDFAALAMQETATKHLGGGSFSGTSKGLPFPPP